AAVLVFGAVPAVLGPSGLDLGRGMVPMPSVQELPNLSVLPDAGFRERWTTAPNEIFPTMDTSDGTKDAATGLLPVELMPWGSMKLYFWGMAAADRWYYAGPALAVQGLVLFVLWLLWRVVRTVGKGEVFSRANARRMVGIGLAVALGGSLVQLLAFAAHE